MLIATQIEQLTSANFATVDDYNVGHDTAHLQACLHLLAEHDV